MKLVEVYRDWRIMAGLSLMILGGANWIIGLDRTEEFSQIIAQAPDISADEAYRRFDELDAKSGPEVLAPLSSQQRNVSYATARMDFYHATFITGQCLVLAGVVLTLLGFIGLIKNDARRARLRLSVGSGEEEPGSAES